MKLSWWDRAVLSTLAYVDQFQYPLSAAEIETRLVMVKPAIRPVTLTQLHRQVKAALAELIAVGLIERQGKWYALAGASALDTVRQTRYRLSQAKWQEVKEFVALVQWVPWIEAVAVTGSLAMDNVVDNDDCDFLIVTQPRRLWLTRLAVIGIAIVKGKRRSWSGEEQNSWCFNLWLDGEHLTMPTSLRTVYGAYEVVQTRWVNDRNQVEARFRHQNAWVQTLLPYTPQLPATQFLSQPQRASWGQWWSRVVDGLEQLAFAFQHWYMSSHMTRERVGAGFAFFHPRDTKAVVTSQWRQRVQQVIPSKK